MLNCSKIAGFLNETTDLLDNREFPTESIITSLSNKLIDIAKQCFDAKEVLSKIKPKIHNEKRCFENFLFDSKAKIKQIPKECTRKN